MKKYLLMTCAMLLAVPAHADVNELLNKVKNKDVSAVETLLSKGENINAANEQGNTALHYAVATGNVRMVELLLAHDADMNIKNNKGWTPLGIAEKKNVGSVYDVLKNKKAADEAKVKKEAEIKAKLEAEKLEAEKAKIAAEAKIKAEIEARKTSEIEARKTAEKARAKTEIKAKQEALAAEQKSEKLTAQKQPVSKDVKQTTVKEKAVVSNVKKNVVKKQPASKKIPLQKNTSKKIAKQVFKASPLAAKVNQGEEEIVYCLQYLGLQGEQKNMLTAAEYYAAENGVNKTRYELVAAEAKHYYENASAEDIKSRADTCGKYITPKQADKQNKIIRSINRTIGL